MHWNGWQLLVPGGRHECSPERTGRLCLNIVELVCLKSVNVERSLREENNHVLEGLVERVLTLQRVERSGSIREGIGLVKRFCPRRSKMGKMRAKILGD